MTRRRGSQQASRASNRRSRAHAAIRREPGGRRFHWLRWALPAALAAVALLLVEVTSRVEAAIDSPYPLAPSVAYHPLLAALDRGADRVAVDGRGLAVELPFESGQTVGDVLALLELEPDQVHGVVGELAKHADLRRIRPRDHYAARFDSSSALRAFELIVDGKGTAVVERSTEGWTGSWRPFTRRVVVDRLSGRLESSLEEAIRAAAGEPAIAYLMADVLQWDLDFTRDLRIGDTFDVLYEKVHLDGSYHSLGEIVAIAYENRGSVLEAYRHGEDGDHGYYDAEGRPLRKMFLRSPLRYSRITSRFSGRRFHPVLKRYKPHYGVDYGAPTGTPARVTANGVVVSAAWDGGGGRTVKVRHPNGYLTAYLHLSKFAESARPGRRVQQGDVIGYVGSSGLATGSHLDYRVQLNGRWIDPLSIKSIPADPVAEEDLPEFMAERDRLRRSLWDGLPYEPHLEDPRGTFTVASTITSEMSGG